MVTARLAVAAERLRSRMRRGRLELESLNRALAALSPTAVLHRGYSITTREGASAPVRDATEVAPGERLVTTLAAGTLRSVVLGRPGEQATLFEEEP